LFIITVVAIIVDVVLIWISCTLKTNMHTAIVQRWSSAKASSMQLRL